MTLAVGIEASSFILAALGFLFGGSVLTKHNSRQKEIAKEQAEAAKEQAVTEYRLKQAEEELKVVKSTVAEMTTNSAVVHSKIENFERHLDKLDMIPDIAAKLNATVDAVKTLHVIVNDLVAARRGE